MIEGKAVTWALALWNSCDLATYYGLEGSGAAVVATPPPYYPCQATSEGYSRIEKHRLSRW